MPNESLECVCLSVILLDSVYKKDNRYYPQVFLEKCKYAAKEKRIHNYIIDDGKISFDSDEEDLLKKIQMEKVLMKKIKYKIFPGFSFSEVEFFYI